MSELTPAQWVAKLGPTAEKVGAQYRISPVGLMAVAALESGWGTSAIAQALHNWMGLNGYPEVLADPVVAKLVDPTHPTVTHDTEQYYGGAMHLSPGEVFLNFTEGQEANGFEVLARWGRGKFFPGVQDRYKLNQADAKTRDGFQTFLTNMVRGISYVDDNGKPAVDYGWCPTPGYVDSVMRLYDVIAANWTQPNTPVSAPGRRTLPAGAHLWYQLSGTPVLRPGYAAYVFDLEQITPALVKQVHDAGARIGAYFEAGSANSERPWYNAYPTSVLGSTMAGWAKEKWTDVRSNDLLHVLYGLIDEADRLGVDFIDPDNMDGYQPDNHTGFPLTLTDCTTFWGKLDDYAKSKGMSGSTLKNGVPDLVDALKGRPLCYINEQGGQYNELDGYQGLGAAVLVLEYQQSGYQKDHGGLYTELRASDQSLDARVLASKGGTAASAPVATTTTTAAPAASGDTTMGVGFSFLDTMVGSTLTPLTAKAWGEPDVSVHKRPDGSMYAEVTFPKGSASPTVARDEGAPVGGCQRLWQISPTDAVTLSYTAELPADFDPVRGGKLGYGLWAGQHFDGGKRPDGTDGLSVRVMWRKGDRGTVGEAYVYAAECPPGAVDTGKGYSLGRGFPLPVGRPFEVAITARLNEPSRASGSLLVQIDGQTVVAATGIRWRTVDRLKVEGVILSTFFGGGDASWATPRDQTIRYSAPTISTPASAPPKEDPVIRDTLADIIDRATAANIGYDQGQRLSWYTDAGGITPGASEADCSSLSAGCWRLAGIPINPDSWTGSMVEDARKVGAAITDITGWTVAQIKARMQPGDLILGPGHVVIVTRDGLVLSADGDENGRASGGKAGDQTGREVYVRDLYARTKGWTHLIAPPGAITSASGFSGVLDVGDQGDAVKRLQSALIARYSWAASILNPAGGADGQYGAATAKVVAEYQRRIGTTPDGEWGPKTNAASIKAEGWGL